MKPGFFTNEVLAELPFSGRLLFAGLWTLADRDGRLEDRPKRIKAALFPWDDVAIDDLLAGLAERGFLLRYQTETVAVIQIMKFHQHQNPHPKEPASALPENPNKTVMPRLYTASPGKAGTSRAVSDPVSDPVSSSKDVSSPAQAPPEPPVLTFPTSGRPDSWDLTEGQVQEWQGLYDGLDVRAECRHALAWVQSLKGHKKTVGGMPRFLVNWLNRATNAGGSRRGAVAPPTVRSWDNWQARCTHTPKCGNAQMHESMLVMEQGRKERASR